MTSLGLFASLLCLATLLGIVNARTLKLPDTIGILLYALCLSIFIRVLDTMMPQLDLHSLPSRIIALADLPGNLLNGALSFLLFAGALHVDVEQIARKKWQVGALAIIGTILSVGFLSGAMWLGGQLLQVNLPFLWCLLLGAIIAPTDPVSVIGMLRQLGLPASLRAVFAGESLLNDGVAIVIFGLAMSVISGQESHISFGLAAEYFALEAVGGALLGGLAGAVGAYCWRLARRPQLQLLVSLSIATGAFSLAQALEMSGPIAVVVAGFCLAGRYAQKQLDTETRQMLLAFWDLIDEILNALLFMLIGLTVFSILPQRHSATLLLLGIPLSILARAASVYLATLPVYLSGAGRLRTLVILTWGGLRGGISLSLALSLPGGTMRETLTPICYGIVVFTILAQGLTMAPVARRLYPETRR